MEIKFEELLERPEILDSTNTQCNLKIEYEQFKSSINFFIRHFGKDAKCIFSEKSAFIIFKEHTNILVILHKENGFNREELYFEKLNMKIIGTNKRKLPNFFVRLRDDLLDNKFIVLFFIVLLIIIFRIINSNNTMIKDLNDALVNVISFFVGTLFMFITLFYEDEKKVDIMIENGKFDTNSENDKYIFNISLMSLVCILISNSLIDLKLNNDIIMSIKEYCKSNFIGLYNIVKNNISFIFTVIGVILLVICFRSITEYYLKKIKTNAINKKILSFKEEYDKENKNSNDI